MKKRSRSYREYWKTNVGFNFEEEYRIFRYLCGHRMLRKPKKNKRFTRKKAWEEYIHSKYMELDNELLREFLHYLNLQKRNRELLQGINISFYLPTVVALITSIWVPELFKLENYFPEMQTYTSLEQSLIALIYSLIVFIIIFRMMFKCMGTFWNQGDEIFFLEDYSKIVSKVMRLSKCCKKTT